MSGAPRASALLLCAVAALASAASARGQAAISTASGGRSPLPGYPHIRGVIPVQDGSLTGAAPGAAAPRAQTQPAGQAAAASRGTLSALTPDCPAGEEPGMNVCWWGGPVVRGAIVHLIFWQGPGTAHAFSSSYIAAVTHFFERVAAASGQDTNVFAVESQYAGSDGAGEYRVLFEPPRDVYIDTEHALPASGSEKGQCTDTASATVAANPCVTEADLRREIESASEVMATRLGSTAAWGKGLEDVYLVLTPEAVGGCFYGVGEGEAGQNACAFARGGYCAYHSSFGTEKSPQVPELASLPDDVAVEGCETYEDPPASEGAAATLDAASHELSEIISDPLGSGWHDLLGYEIGDKCVPPLSFEPVGALITGIYGLPLGGEPSRLGLSNEVIAGTLFNQQIGGAGYWLQDEWSNSASAAGGGCVQRLIPVQLSVPQGAAAGVPAAFTGSAGEPSDPVDYWVWSFGDGEQLGAAQPTVTHTYSSPGTYTVALTEYDRYGNSNMAVQRVVVGPAPPPGTTSSSSATVTTTITATTARRARRYSLAALLRQLGLPSGARPLPGLGRIALGQAACPPACSLTVRIYAQLTRRRRGRRVRRAVLIGSLQMAVAAGKRRAIALRLNAAGRRMLERLHRLRAEVAILVGDAEGGTFSIRRTYTLSAPARRHAPARRRRSARTAARSAR